MKQMRKVVPFALAMLLAFSFCACSAKGTASDDRVAGGASGENQMSGVPEDAVAAPGAGTNTGMTQDKATIVPEQPGGAPEGSVRKLIRNASYALETLDYEASLAALEALVTASGGYVESSSTTGLGATRSDYYDPRVANYTVRIPAEGLDSFGTKLADIGSITQTSSSVEEITDYYYDTEAHIRNLKVQEERLLELIKQADTLENLVYLESTLSNVRYEIESLEGTLRRLDAQVAMSTVTVSLTEVYEYSPVRPVPQTLGERIRDEFSRNMASLKRGAEDFVVFLLGNIVGVLFWCILIAGVVIFLVRRMRSKRRLRHIPPETPREDEKQ
ncbi:MAG: DUF4349 domain-containing protein [Clostridia bacterium]|nr:DUF4349 domain-containing protein [Clostridia bacterium]